MNHPQDQEGTGAQRVEPRTAVVTEALRTSIIEGELQPGDRIRQDTIGRMYGVSRSPVREALRELASEGWVQLTPNAGARVAPLDPSELIEVYLMREAIEPIAVARAAGVITDPEKDALSRLRVESEGLAEQEDLPGYVAADYRLHFALLEISGYTRIVEVARGLWAKTARYRSVYLLPDYVEQSERLATSVIEHRQILDAVGRGAAEDAADIYRVHTRRTRLTLLTERPELENRSGRPNALDGERART